MTEELEYWCMGFHDILRPGGEIPAHWANEVGFFPGVVNGMYEEVHCLFTYCEKCALAHGHSRGRMPKPASRPKSKPCQAYLEVVTTWRSEGYNTTKKAKRPCAFKEGHDGPHFAYPPEGEKA